MKIQVLVFMSEIKFDLTMKKNKQIFSVSWPNFPLTYDLLI